MWEKVSLPGALEVRDVRWGPGGAEPRQGAGGRGGKGGGGVAKQRPAPPGLYKFGALQ